MKSMYWLVSHMEDDLKWNSNLAVTLTVDCLAMHVGYWEFFMEGWYKNTKAWFLVFLKQIIYMKCFLGCDSVCKDNSDMAKRIISELMRDVLGGGLYTDYPEEYDIDILRELGFGLKIVFIERNKPVNIFISGGSKRRWLDITRREPSHYGEKEVEWLSQPIFNIGIKVNIYNID